MPKTLEPFKDELPKLHTIKPPKKSGSKIVIKMRNGKVKLHKDLPETDIWGYEGKYPGPIIEVEKGKRLSVEWKNELNAGSMPLRIVTAKSDFSQKSPGIPQSDISDETDAAKIPNAGVVHLHGAATHPDSDGWTDNVLLKSQSAHDTFENEENSTLFWYHDHAMGITRFNVYAGLAGLYIVRDQIEKNLHLPNDDFEIAMLLQDRNLDTDANGDLTGKLLHKVEDGTMEFFGPFNLVNGRICPFKKVERAVYRFRMVNGSNARTYKLKLLDESNAPYTTNIFKQIGSDGGLFRTPVDLENNEIILSPGERADIIADFRNDDIKHRNLTWVNIAKAPFDGTFVPLPADLDNIELGTQNDIRQTDIRVIRFQVGNGSVNNNYDISTFTTGFKRIKHKLEVGDDPSRFIVIPDNHNHRLIALVEEPFYKRVVTDDPHSPLVEIPMLMLRELIETDLETYSNLVLNNEFSIILGTASGIKFYRSVASMFYDSINFFIRYNDWEVWKIINLTGDTHPFHVHLVQFQALRREAIVPEITESSDIPRPINTIGSMKFNLVIGTENQLDANEQGWKDTIRVNPNEMMSIAMQFKGHCGRYMYHCHLLEHEDREMMRPFVVLPDYIIDNMQMGGGNGGHHHH